MAPSEVPYWRTNPRDTLMHHVASDFDVTYLTNLHGLRNRPIRPKTPGITRIVHIGDSFTFGWGVDEQYSIPQILEQKLGPKYEVVNFGVPGTNPPNFYRYVKNYIPLLQPDLVVVSIYKVRNTFLGGNVAALGGPERYIRDIVATAEQSYNPESEARESPLWASSLYRLAYRAQHGIDYRYAGVDWPGPAATRLRWFSLISQANAAPINNHLDDTVLRAPATAAVRRDEVAVTIKLAAMMAELAATMRAKFIPVILPVVWQITDRQDGADPLDYTALLDQALLEQCRFERLACLDGSPSLRSFAKGKPWRELAFQDTHFRPSLNTVTAEILAAAIR